MGAFERSLTKGLVLLVCVAVVVLLQVNLHVLPSAHGPSAAGDGGTHCSPACLQRLELTEVALEQLKETLREKSRAERAARPTDATAEQSSKVVAALTAQLAEARRELTETLAAARLELKAAVADANKRVDTCESLLQSMKDATPPTTRATAVAGTEDDNERTFHE